MAYPSDNKPRRRMQAVPTMQQMIRRRAASPAGALKKGGVGYLGPPVKNGGIPRRKQPQGNAWGWNARQAGTTQGALQRRQQPPGGQPGPQYEGGGRPGVNPNQWVTEVTEPGADHNPLEHQRYWASKGWLLDPTVTTTSGHGKFVYVGPKALEQYLTPGNNFDENKVRWGGPDDGRPNPQQPPVQGGPPGGQPGPVTGGGQGGGGVGAGGGGTQEPPVTGPAVPNVEPSTDLPLDPYYEQQRRLLADQLAQRLGMIAPQREQVLADRALQEARLGTNETVDQRHMLESLASRGAFGGGIQTRDQGYLSTDYLRQRQDLASNVAQALAGLSQGESEANLMYQQGLMEALLELANRQAMSEYAVTPHPDTTELPYEDWFGSDLPPIDTGGGGGGAGGGGGGGGGNWEPSWKPTWKPDWKPTWQPPNRRRR